MAKKMSDATRGAVQRICDAAEGKRAAEGHRAMFEYLIVAKLSESEAVEAQIDRVIVNRLRRCLSKHGQTKRHITFYDD